jgi:cytochrome c biogenesis protein ResB
MPTGKATRRFMAGRAGAVGWPSAGTGADAAHRLQADAASVFQVTARRARNWCTSAVLPLGVLTMLYVRERRLWIWLQSDGAGGTRVQAALSTTRRTLDADAEFESLKTALLKDAR